MSFYNLPLFAQKALGQVDRRTPRERTLSEWRRSSGSPFGDLGKDHSKPVEQIMGGVLKNLKLNKKQREIEILKVWNASVDPNITAHAQPVGINKGTLFVNVDNSVWLHEIVRYRYKEILTRLQTSFGKETIARISFRAG